MTWIGTIRITMANRDEDTGMDEQTDINIPDFLRVLHDDWFGESTAPYIFRAVNLESWDVCRRLLTELDDDTIRKDLRHVDIYGYSALHYACWWRSSPLDIVTQIVEYSPADYPAQRNRKGRTPLHLASWRGPDEVVQLLARRCPEAASVMDKNEKSPLSDACSRNRSKLVLEALIDADSSQIVKRNSQGRTPAHTFFRISHGVVTVPTRTRFSNAEDKEEYAEKVRLILSTERMVQQKPKLDLWNELGLLRAAIESPSCSFAYIKCLLDQIDIKKLGDFRDEEGNTLLRIAIQADHFEFNTFYKCDRCSDYQDKMYFNRDPDRAHWGVRCTGCSGNGRTVKFHYVQIPVVGKEASIVKYLVTRHPHLARIRGADGRLPLELALQTGHSWYMGIDELVKAYPEALFTPERKSGLYPFLLASTTESTEDEDKDISNLQPPRKRQKMADGTSYDSTAQQSGLILETIYQLLKECPNLVKTAIPT